MLFLGDFASCRAILLVTYCMEVFVPQGFHAVPGLVAEDVLHGSVPRPRVELCGRSVELAYEVLVLVQLKPVEEVACHPVALAPRVALGPVLAGKVLLEASACQAHGIRHALDEAPVLAPVAVRAASLGFQLVGVGQLVVQYAARLIVEAHGVFVGKALLNPSRGVADTHVVASSVFPAYPVLVHQAVEYAVNVWDVFVLRAEIQCLQHPAGILLYVGDWGGYYGAIDLRPVRLWGLVLEDDIPWVVLLSFLLDLDGSMVLAHLLLRSCRQGSCQEQDDC